LEVILLFFAEESFTSPYAFAKDKGFFLSFLLYYD
jgi:hypothetical protein